MSKTKMSIPEEIQHSVSVGKPGAVMIVPERPTSAEDGMLPQIRWWLITERHKFQVVALILIVTSNGIMRAWDISTLPFTIGLMQRNFEKKADVFAMWDTEGRVVAIPGPNTGMELVAVCARTVKEERAIPLAVRASFKEQAIPAGTSFWDVYEDPTMGIVDVKKDPRTVRLWQEELWALQETVRSLLDTERMKTTGTAVKPEIDKKENLENEEDKRK